MKVYKLRYPFENFDEKIFKLIFSLKIKNNKLYDFYEDNEILKEIIDKSIESFSDENVIEGINFRRKNYKFEINYEETMSIGLNKNESVYIEVFGGILDNKEDIISAGMINFNIDKYGMLSSISYEQL